MATATTKLALRKPDPDPVTGDFISVQTDLNDNWDKIDAAFGVQNVANGVRPSTPYSGQAIRETGTGRLFMYLGGAWTQISTAGGVQGPIVVEDASALTTNLLSRVTGDAHPRFTVLAHGAINWGSGTVAQDVNLYRGGPNILRTDDGLDVAGTLRLGSAQDVNLYRSGADVLRTDDQFTCKACNVGAHAIVTSASQSIASGGSGSILNWTGQQRNVGSMWSSGSTLTLPFTGSYQIIFNATWPAQAGGVRSAVVRLDGIIISENKMNTTGQIEPVSASTEIWANSGQQITAGLFQTSGATLGATAMRLSVRLTGM